MSESKLEWTELLHLVAAKTENKPLWMVFDLDSVFLREIRAKKLMGVQGVSHVYESLTDMLSENTAVLMMPEPAFLATNPQSRKVEYTVESMLKNNLRWWHRVLRHGGNGPDANLFATVIRQYFTKLTDLEGRPHSVSMEEEYPFLINLTDRMTAWVTAHPATINSIDHLVKYLQIWGRANRVPQLDAARLKKVIRLEIDDVIVGEGSMEEEEEWDVGGILHVPFGSTIFISTDCPLTAEEVKESAPWLKVRALNGPLPPTRGELISSSTEVLFR